MTFMVQLVILQTTFTLLLVQFTDIARKTKKEEIFSGEGKEGCFLVYNGWEIAIAS